MKVIRFHEFGDINVLRYEEAPTPRPGPGEVLQTRRRGARVDAAQAPWHASAPPRRD